MRLVLLGLPGAGKGSVAAKIAAEYKIPHISTGDIVREAVATGGDLGRAANSYMSKGELIPDQLVIKMVEERLGQADCSTGWLLDGYPRTVAQAEALDQSLAQRGQDVQMAFEIRVPPQVAIERITKRRVCRKCGAIYNLNSYLVENPEICAACGGELYRRPDDREDTVRHRLDVYLTQTHPVVHYYSRDAKLYSVDGTKGVAGVFEDIDHYVQSVTG